MKSVRAVLLVLSAPLLLLVGFLAYLGGFSVGVPAAAVSIVLAAVLGSVLYVLALRRRTSISVVVALAIALGLSVALAPAVSRSKVGADRSAVAILFVPPTVLLAILATLAGALGRRLGRDARAGDT